MSAPHTRSPVVPRNLGLVSFGAGLTHAGRLREENEDAILTDPGGVLWAIADGMGGHGHGAMASDMVIDQITLVTDLASPFSSIVRRLEVANRAIHEKAARDGLGQIGATAVAMLVRNSVGHIVWVGDCRAYLLRAGRLRQLTRDHSVVQEMVDQGLLSDGERHRHPQRHVVTRAVGAETEIDVATAMVPLSEGDRILLCSDGLTACVEDRDIARHMSADSEPRDICAGLVKAALDSGAPDNVSVICVYVRAP